MSRRTSRTAVVVTAAAAAVAVGTAAWAYYAITSSTASSTAVARSLSGPGSPTATATGSTTVNVAWTLPASNLPGAQYVVTNTTDNHTVCTVASTVTTCSDTAALPGVVNAYSIKATLTGSTWATTPATFSSGATPDVLLITRANDTAIGTQTAGTAFNVKVTAQKWNGSALATDTLYTGNKTVVWSGLTASPDATAPTYPTTTLAFTSGATTSATLNVTAVDAGSATLTVTEGARTGSASFTVNAAIPVLRFNGTSSACGSTTAITTLTGKISRDLDDYGNTATFSGTATVALGPTNKGSFSPTSVSFANNGAKDTGTFTYTPSGSGNVTLTATSAGYTTGTCTVKQ